MASRPCPHDVDIVVIHDGVRPFVTHRMIEESIQTARQFKAAVVAMPVKETIKMVTPGPDRPKNPGSRIPLADPDTPDLSGRCH